MFNKDFLFSAIKHVFAGDPIKFKFYLSIIQYCCFLKKIIAHFLSFLLLLFEVYTKLRIFANEFRT